MSINPLPALARRFPAAFGLEWVEDDDFVKTGPAAYDMRPIRQIRGAWHYIDKAAA